MNYSAEAPEEDRDEVLRRGITDVLNEIRGHLTKDELLSISIFKNSRRKCNTIQRVFFQKYHGKILSPSAMTMRKKRMFEVLHSVGNLLRFKKENNIDIQLKQLLTTRQYQILVLCERRKTLVEIEAALNIKWRAISYCFKRVLTRLEEDAKTNRKISNYLALLRNVLKFSRKSRYADEKRRILR